MAFVFGTGAAFDVPARQAFVNEMVGPERLVNAVALNSAAFNLARMIGPALAGLLIAWLGSGVTATGWVILVNATTYARRDRVADPDAHERAGAVGTDRARPRAAPRGHRLRALGDRTSCS